MVVNDTASFREALRTCVSAAEGFLAYVREHPLQYPKYDKRWFDHRERELFQSFCDQNDWTGAKRIVELTEDPQSKAGRMQRLEERSGKKYNEL